MNKTLDDVDRYFGFTREYPRQVYYKIQGKKYTEVYKEKRQKWNKVKNFLTMKPRVSPIQITIKKEKCHVRKELHNLQRQGRFQL